MRSETGVSSETGKFKILVEFAVGVNSGRGICMRRTRARLSHRIRIFRTPKADWASVRDNISNFSSFVCIFVCLAQMELHAPYNELLLPATLENFFIHSDNGSANQNVARFVFFAPPICVMRFEWKPKNEKLKCQRNRPRNVWIAKRSKYCANVFEEGNACAMLSQPFHGIPSPNAIRHTCNFFLHSSIFCIVQNFQISSLIWVMINLIIANDCNDLRIRMLLQKFVGNGWNVVPDVRKKKKTFTVNCDKWVERQCN